MSMVHRISLVLIVNGASTVRREVNRIAKTVQYFTPMGQFDSLDSWYKAFLKSGVRICLTFGMTSFMAMSCHGYGMATVLTVHVQ